MNINFITKTLLHSTSIIIDKSIINKNYESNVQQIYINSPIMSE